MPEDWELVLILPLWFGLRAPQEFANSKVNAKYFTLRINEVHVRTVPPCMSHSEASIYDLKVEKANPTSSIIFSLFLYKITSLAQAYSF